MPKLNKTYLKDLGERVAWTLAEAGVAFAITETSDLKTAYAPLIATGLAFVKGLVAKHLHPEDNSASTVSVG